MGEYRSRLVPIVKKCGLSTSATPLRLASGATSYDFVDGKRALSEGVNLKLACEALIELASEDGIEFDAVGGLTMGADAFSHGIALLKGCSWFSVRKEPKGRGTNKLIEGAELTAASKVLLVDDVVTTGGSMMQAYKAINAEGARIVAAVALVDRSDATAQRFKEIGIPYKPLVTYRDLGIEAVRLDGLVSA